MRDVSDGAFHVVSFLIAFALVTYVTVVLGELAPKYLAIQRALQVALWSAYPLHYIYRLAYPFIWLMNRSAAGVLRAFGLKPTGELDAARVPADFEAQRVLHFDEPRAGEAGRSVHGPGVGGDAVDLVGREAGVLDGGHARVEREVERVAEEAAADVGLPHAADDGAPLDRVYHHQAAGSNNGM